MAGKEAVVIIIDVSKTMAQELDGKVKLSTACEASKLLVQQKLILSKSHEVGVILMGTEDTHNDLAENLGGYEHISVLEELDMPSLDTLTILSAVEPSTTKADILDSIVVAVSMIEAKIGSKKYKKRLFILTDGNCLCNSVDQLQDIIDQINIQDIRINIIALGFLDTEKQNKQQKHVSEVLNTLIASVQGAIYPSNTAMQIYKQFRKRSVYPVAKYKGPLDLGLGYTLNVCIYGKTKEEPLPSLKKHSCVVDFTSDAKEGLVKMTREAALEDDPSSTVIDSEDIIKAYFYGKSVVPVSLDDEDQLKYPTRKCIKVLGYLSAVSIPRHFFMSGVDMVLPFPDPEHEKAFAAFVQALYQRDDVVLIRYCAKDNQVARLAVLSPCIKPDLICLWLNYLPTSEDYRDFPFNDLPVSTQSQQEVTEAFIQALSLDKTEEQEERLKPSSLFSPTLQYFYQCLGFRAENPKAPLPPLDENIEKYLRPDREMFNKAAQECENFAKAFQLKEVEVQAKEKKMYVDLLKGKPDEPVDEEEMNVGEGDPIEDFEKMIKDRKKDRVDLAIRQMEEVVVRLLEKDFKGNLHRKIIDCIRALRRGCVEEEQPNDFNSFLAIKVRHLQSIYPDFWNFMVDQGITLISVNECKASRVSQNEAKAFLVKVQKAQVSSSVPDLDEIE